MNLDSLKVYTINGEKYYVHVVEQGNTLYGISRIYSISVEDLQRFNPKIANNLTIGDRLLIPINALKKKDVKENLGYDGNFLIYKVQSKNTLYSIAREYGVEIKDILNENPQLSDGLKPGQEIKIPLEKIKKEKVVGQYSEPAVVGKYKTHKVQPKETLYSLSRMYSVEIDSILYVNDNLVGGLQIGQVINIPILRKEQNTFVTYIEFDSTGLREVYEVALLLPFYLDNIQLPTDSSELGFKEDENLHYKHARYGIEFYEGFLLAVDSLKKYGLSVNLHIFDTAKDTAKLQRILRQPNMKKMDLIVGPLFYDEFMIASDFAKKHKINIVSPVKQSNKILLGNIYVSKVVSSDPVLIKSLANFLVDSLKEKNILLVYPDNVEERLNADLFYKNYKEALSNVEDSMFYSLPVNYIWNKKSSLESLSYKLSPDSSSKSTNIIVVLSKNQSFVTQLLTSLNDISQQYDIVVIGMESWQKYSNLDLDYLHNLNVHILLPEYIDETDQRVMYFRNQFYDTYKTLPDKFSYLGFDVAAYYLSLLNQYGVNYNSMLEEYKISALGRNFNFFKTGIESGFENHSFNIIKYEDFQEIKVK